MSSSPRLLDAMLTGFHSQVLCGLFFSTQVFHGREPGVGLGLFTPQGGSSAAEIALLTLNHHIVGVRPAHPVSPHLLPASMWLLLYFFNYWNSVQLYFRWLAMMVVL